VDKFQGGWITSLPGDHEVMLEVLPALELPAKLRKLGYIIQLADPPFGERIRPPARVEHVLSEDKIGTIAVTHAGIVLVLRYTFAL
jgi:hypothetical protein